MERVNAVRHKNSVAMDDHRSTIVRHGLFSARSMQVTLPDKNPPPRETPKEPIISFLKCLQFAGWSVPLELLVLPRGCTLAGLENTVLMYSCQIQLVPWFPFPNHCLSLHGPDWPISSTLSLVSTTDIWSLKFLLGWPQFIHQRINLSFLGHSVSTQWISTAFSKASATLDVLKSDEHHPTCTHTFLL